MTLPTPETLVRHELAGLPARVVDAPNPDLVGLAGRVVDETTRTLQLRGVRDGQRRAWQVPKAGTTFAFALTDEAAASTDDAGTAFEPGTETAGNGDAPAAGGSGSADREVGSETGGDPATRYGEDVATVTVDGARLVERPARRTEVGGFDTWH